MSNKEEKLVKPLLEEQEDKDANFIETASDVRDREYDKIHEKQREKREDRGGANILSIDGTINFETPEDIRRKHLNEFAASEKAGRPMTGKIVGARNLEIKETEEPVYCAILKHGDFEILIPHPFFSHSEKSFRQNEDGVFDPEDYNRKVRRLINSYIGSEIEYIVVKTDPNNNLVIANRIAALDKKVEDFYIPSEGFEKAKISEGQIVEARVCTTDRAGVVVEVMGAEVYIPNRELSYNWINDAGDLFRNGERVPVLITGVDLKKTPHRTVVSVEASIKQVYPDPRVEAFERIEMLSTYLGVVTGINEKGIFVNLGDIDCFCLFPNNGVIPSIKSEVTVKVTRKLEDRLFINGIITHVQ